MVVIVAEILMTVVLMVEILMVVVVVAVAVAAVAALTTAVIHLPMILPSSITARVLGLDHHLPRNSEFSSLRNRRKRFA
jgi:hypothetical protein